MARRGELEFSAFAMTQTKHPNSRAQPRKAIGHLRITKPARYARGAEQLGRQYDRQLKARRLSVHLAVSAGDSGVLILFPHLTG